MEKEIFEQAETITQTMQGRVKITPLSPMKYAVPGIDPYLMPRVRMGGLVDHVAVSRWSGVGLGGKWEGKSSAEDIMGMLVPMHQQVSQALLSWGQLTC
jgi:hypothetical protein